MRVSEINKTTFADYIGVEEEDSLQIYIDGAIAFVKGYTSLSKEELDQHEDVAICVMAVASDMYEHRLYQTDRKSYLNELCSNILSMHATDWL